MERLTKNIPVSEMGMYELAHNSCFARNGEAFYRDYDTEISARDFARKLFKTYAPDEYSEDDEELDNILMDDLMFGADENIIGLIALFYRSLWVQADLYERLKHYENFQEQGKLLELPCSMDSSILCSKVLGTRLQAVSGFYARK